MKKKIKTTKRNKMTKQYLGYKRPHPRTVLKTDSIRLQLLIDTCSRKKYNNTLDRTDLSVIDYLQHAKEETQWTDT